MGFLIKQLCRVHALLRHAHTAQIPVEDIVLSRREFAAGSVQASAFAATLYSSGFLTACKPRAEANLDAKIVIIGAGLAGLNCAYQLKRAGIAAMLFEAAPTFGGRVQTDRQQFGTIRPADLGGEFISSDHVTMLALAKDLGIELLDYTFDDAALAPLSLWLSNKKVEISDFLKLYAPVAAKIDAAFAVFENDEIRVSYKNANGAAALDAMSLHDWLDQQKISGIVRSVLESVYTEEYGLDPHDNNVLNMLLQIGTETTKLRLRGDNDRRYKALEGADLFVTQLYASLSDSALYPDHRLVALRQAADGRYQVTFDRTKLGASREVTCDHVVLALPFNKLRDVAIDARLPDVKSKAINELTYGQRNKLICGFSSRPWREKGASGVVITDLDFQVAWDSSRMLTGDQALLTQSRGGSEAIALINGAPIEQTESFSKALNEIFPGSSAAATGHSLRANWTENPYIGMARAAYGVGQMTTIAGCEGERVGNLHFCGEHTSVLHQGTMEGAVQTGKQVADLIASELSR